MISHYLLFKGDCADALEVYKRAFGAVVGEKRLYEDSPGAGGKSDCGRVLHASLKWDDNEIMCADASTDVTSGDNMYVSVTPRDKAAATDAWNILKEDGVVYMDLAQTFFAEAHGSLRDKFGVNWMFTVAR